MTKIKTIFVGTSDFALPVLEQVLKLDYIDLACVITQPDRPVGRKQVLTPPPVKQYLIDHNIAVAVEQPEKIRAEYKQILEKYQPELILVASYGQIIPKAMLDYPKYSCLNIHVSLLPELRGAVPMPMAILKGFAETGVTLQKMSPKMDEGEIIATRKFSLEVKETTETLTKKASNIAAQMIKEDLFKWVTGELTLIQQDESKATYCFMSDIAKEKAQISYETDINLAERMIRAFYPWPVAWFKLKDGRRVKVFEGEIVQNYELLITNYEVGQLQLVRQGDGLYLVLGNGGLELQKLQVEGKGVGSGKDYLYLVGGV